MVLRAVCPSLPLGRQDLTSPQSAVLTNSITAAQMQFDSIPNFRDFACADLKQDMVYRSAGFDKASQDDRHHLTRKFKTILDLRTADERESELSSRLVTHVDIAAPVRAEILRTASIFVIM